MLKFLTSRRMWGGIIAGVSTVLPMLTGGMFGAKAQAWGLAIGTILYATGAVGADGKVATQAAAIVTDTLQGAALPPSGPVGAGSPVGGGK